MENIYLTEKQVAEKYTVDTRTLYNFRKAGKLENGIHFFYIGNIVYIAYVVNVTYTVYLPNEIFLNANTTAHNAPNNPSS